MSKQGNVTREYYVNSAISEGNREHHDCHIMIFIKYRFCSRHSWALLK